MTRLPAAQAITAQRLQSKEEYVAVIRGERVTKPAPIGSSTITASSAPERSVNAYASESSGRLPSRSPDATSG